MNLSNSSFRERNGEEPSLFRAAPSALVDQELEVVTLGARPGFTPSAKPPVRIFLGTEVAQHRAERIFVWSIEKVRDPSRVYELYLLKGLKGFDARNWLTGFTNYRFVVPHLAGGKGQAIYNDTDQIYLTDPAILFDIGLGSHGFLSVSPQDTSVMLIDCERMCQVWTLRKAQNGKRKHLEAAAMNIPDLWGPLSPKWNTRDSNYNGQRADLIHYTTIHAQPWQPSPDRYSYQHSPARDIWFNLEDSANDAGYHIFGPTNPSKKYLELIAVLKSLPTSSLNEISKRIKERSVGHHKSICELITQTKARKILISSLSTKDETAVANDRIKTFHEAPVIEVSAGLVPGEDLQLDGVICLAAMDFVPDEDIPWVLERIFGSARQFVYVTVDKTQDSLSLPASIPLPRYVRSAAWWKTQFDRTSIRHPTITWHLKGTRVKRAGKGRGTGIYSSDRPIDYVGGNLRRDPSVWTLTGDKPGQNTQVLGLAKSIGLPFTTKRLRFRSIANLHGRLTGKIRASRFGIEISNSDALRRPWPDLIISAGWRSTRVARWIQKQNSGRTQLILLGRKSCSHLYPTDISVVCSHYRLPPHPRRINITTPITSVSIERLEAGARNCMHLVRDSPHPWIMVFLGGATDRKKIDAKSAYHMGARIRSLASKLNGKVFATTSRRTGDAAAKAFISGLGSPHFVYTWRPDEADNPYMGYLALADILIVTGESESMLAEASRTHTPLYIYRLSEQPNDILGRCKEWLLHKAQEQKLTTRGSIKPQKGFARFCARLIEHGFVYPRRRLETLHDALVEQKVAEYFDVLDTGELSREFTIRERFEETETVAKRVRQLLSFHVSP